MDISKINVNLEHSQINGVNNLTSAKVTDLNELSGNTEPILIDTLDEDSTLTQVEKSENWTQNPTEEDIAITLKINPPAQIVATDRDDSGRIIAFKIEIADSELLGFQAQKLSSIYADFSGTISYSSNGNMNISYQEHKKTIPQSIGYDKDGFRILSEVELADRLCIYELNATSFDEVGKITAFEYINSKGETVKGTVTYDENGIHAHWVDYSSWFVNQFNPSTKYYDRYSDLSKDGEIDSSAYKLKSL